MHVYKRHDDNQRAMRDVTEAMHKARREEFITAGTARDRCASGLTGGDSCDGGINVLYNCLSWSKFVNTHLSHSRQLYNIHKVTYGLTACTP